MLYEAIRLASKKYHDLNSGPRYDCTLTQRSVWGWEEAPNSEQVDSIRSFVNSWGTRMQATTHELHSTLGEIWPSLSDLKCNTILDVDLCDSTMRDLIGCCFDRMAKSNAKKRNEATGASKMLHMINPKLFLMWDASIVRGYGGHFNVLLYTDFLRRMQMLAKFAIKQVRENEPHYSDETAIASLTGCKRTLAKTLDEYNYVKFTLNDESVWKKEYEL